MMDKILVTVLIVAGIYLVIYIILKKIGLLDRSELINSIRDKLKIKLLKVYTNHAAK